MRVADNTQGPTLQEQVHQFTHAGCQVFTDEYASYNHVDRLRSTVAHGLHEWARDDDGDGVREVHTNTIEGLWTGLRNFLRPFRGVSKYYLSGYVAIHEFRVNLKRISPDLISSLVSLF